MWHLVSKPHQSTSDSTPSHKKSLWKCIQRMEQIQNNARMIIKALAIQDQWRGLTHVISSNLVDHSTWIKTLSKAELEKLCLEEAGCWFTQAASTLFLQPPLLEIFLEANVFSKVFDQVLAGTFKCPTGTDPMVICLIQAMQWLDNIPQIPSRLLEEVTTGWHKAREATSSAPSAVHFGHYMAGTFNPTIVVFIARLANLGFTTRYSLKWWQTGLNIMLEKQAGNMNIEKLHIILLF